MPTIGNPAPQRALGATIAVLAPRAGLVRFLGSGLLNTAFGYAAFLVALKAGAPPTLALVASTLFGTLFNFETSRRLVFQSRQTGRLASFIGVYAMVFIVDDFAIVVLHTFGLRAALAQAVLILPMALLSFLGQRRFVFPEERRSR